MKTLGDGGLGPRNLEDDGPDPKSFGTAGWIPKKLLGRLARSAKRMDAARIYIKKERISIRKRICTFQKGNGPAARGAAVAPRGPDKEAWQ